MLAVALLTASPHFRVIAVTVAVVTVVMHVHIIKSAVDAVQCPEDVITSVLRLLQNGSRPLIPLVLLPGKVEGLYFLRFFLLLLVDFFIKDLVLVGLLLRLWL